MNENGTNNKPQEVESKIPFWNRISGGGLILGGIIFIAVLYFTWWIPRTKCINQIAYYPATESVPLVKAELGFVGGKGMAEHYAHGSRNFKTRSEALSYCMNK